MLNPVQKPPDLVFILDHMEIPISVIRKKHQGSRSCAPPIELDNLADCDNPVFRVAA